MILKLAFPFLVLLTLSACTVASLKETPLTLGYIPTVSQLRSAVDLQYGLETLSTTNCERTECYEAAFDNVDVKNVTCQSLKIGKAECSYEYTVAHRLEEWVKAHSLLGIEISSGEKPAWRIVPSTF